MRLPAVPLSAAVLRLACCLSGLLAAAPVLAQTTSLERIAQSGGQIMAAARACRINAERIRSTSERLLRLVNDRAASLEEKASIARLFAASQSGRSPAPRASRARCTGVHVEFSEMEARLARPPAPTSAALAARRARHALSGRQGAVAAAELKP